MENEEITCFLTLGYNLLKIKLNDALWTENEREELIDRALQIHLEKRRRVQLDEPAFKRQRYNNDDKSYGLEVDSDNDDSDID